MMWQLSKNGKDKKSLMYKKMPQKLQLYQEYT